MFRPSTVRAYLVYLLYNFYATVKYDDSSFDSRFTVTDRKNVS